MTDSPALDQRGAAFALAVLDVVAKRAATMLTDGKNRATTDYFRSGDRIALDDTDGTPIGLVWMTKPKPIAEIVNEAALRDYLAEKDPDAIGEVDEITGTTDEVADVLRAHAPHLLATRTVVREQHRAAVLKAAVKPRAKLIPGVEVHTPHGSITVKLEDEGRDRIAAMIADGTVNPLQALPPAGTAEGAA